MTKSLLFICSTLLLSSCVATNNLYINDPVPPKMGEGAVYIGLGTGITPVADSISPAGFIYFSDKTTTSVNLCAGGQLGLTDKVSGRAAIHFPSLVGGFGLRIGAQYSFFDSTARINAAIGADLGYVTDFDSTSESNKESTIGHSTGARNADIFIPISFRWSDHSRIIITPRYSFNSIFMRQHILDESSGYSFRRNFASFTVGLMTKKIYFEASIHAFENQFYPSLGLVYVLQPRDIEKLLPEEAADDVP